MPPRLDAHTCRVRNTSHSKKSKADSPSFTCSREPPSSIAAPATKPKNLPRASTRAAWNRHSSRADCSHGKRSPCRSHARDFMTDPNAAGTSPILASLEALASSYRARFETATTEQSLRDENAKILGKKGELTALLKEMGKVPQGQRKAIGERVNALRSEV